ncbi:MAG: acyl-CoA dehydrogenase [Pseudomonadales bacterium]|nr:acyl-CoA dehydrogenase [Pseudomonadales bacterium]
MSLVYNDDERMLAEAARGFLEQNSSPAALRRLRDTRDADGFSRDLWHGMAALGWAGMLVPEEYGGLGFAHTGAGILCEQSGRMLAASPLFATAILGVTLLRDAGSAAQKNELLPAIAAGRLLCALAVDESARHDPAAIALLARADGDAFHLSGEKILVLDGHVADTFIVAARSRGTPGETAGISLFLVPAGSAGLAIERTVMVDSRNAAIVRFDHARGELLGELHQGWKSLERALDIGRICLAAEMLGVAGEAFARTVAYLGQRRQFGRVIGEFQALQHRAAVLFCELELARSAVLRALRAIDEPHTALAPLASLAKARAGDAATLAVNEAVQLHGGIGMTDEFEIGFFVKRAAALRQIFGDSYFHTDRYAALNGY